jgi:hypothetical protein
MKAIKVPDGIEPYLLEAGEYCKWNGIIYAMTPDGKLANLANHTIINNQNGTITVSPSILVSGGEKDGSWHGYLENDVWREV